ncbi:hypothetical protein ECP02999174_4984 [Escherichia coli P0299917.4]|nr:hypothetical protein ECEPECC34262_5221 [Escherichia coli EPEC C342-62]ENC51732.1 hypothetical protein ECP02999174_4984 [Escherichia coli P0299917.4]EZJ09986.1 hypothetical protein AD39_5185 [Escherichia coli 1-182-04_S4_C3]
MPDNSEWMFPGKKPYQTNNITIMSTVTNDCIGLKTMNYSE